MKLRQIRIDCNEEEAEAVTNLLTKEGWEWVDKPKPAKETHYRKFTPRQQVLIKMAAAMKIKHFKIKETVGYFGADKCQGAIDEYEEILKLLTRT